jgi:hypothetical protein
MVIFTAAQKANPEASVIMDPAHITAPFLATVCHPHNEVKMGDGENPPTTTV